jgi:hypothetical protein
MTRQYIAIVFKYSEFVRSEVIFDNYKYECFIRLFGVKLLLFDNINRGQ